VGSVEFKKTGGKKYLVVLGNIRKRTKKLCKNKEKEKRKKIIK
jgi:hypothetical protein